MAHSMFEIDPDVLLYQSIGIIGFACGCYAFAEKDSRKFKLKLGVFNSVMIIHFVLMGAYTSAGVIFVAALRTFISTYTKSTAVMLTCMTAIVFAGAYTLSSHSEILTIVGAVIGTYALFKLDGVVMRVCILVNSLCWFINNLLLGSIGGIAAELIFIVINITTIFRLLAIRSLEGQYSVER